MIPPPALNLKLVEFEEIKEEEKIVTQELAHYIEKTSSRCTQASLRAFEITGYPFYASGCLSYFHKNNFTLESFPIPPNTKMKSLQSMLNKDLDYFILTAGHAMSVRNGILVDTSGRYWNNSTVEHVWEVRKK